ncbi:MAG: hypothetical protein ACOY0T_19005 [Myxococcota bacterium]
MVDQRLNTTDELRARLRAFLGIGDLTMPVSPRVDEEVREDGFVRKSVSYEVAGERIPAFLLEPVNQRREVAVVALHQHNSQWHIGKSEVAGLRGDALQAFGPELARAGVAVLAPDALGFESRCRLPEGQAGPSFAMRARRAEQENARVSFAPPPKDETIGERVIRGLSLVKSKLTRHLPIERGNTREEWVQYYNHAMHRLVRGELLMRRFVEDTAAAVSALRVLSGAPCVGLLGHSFGGNVALFAGALDERVAFTVSSGAACSYRHKLGHGVGLEMGLVIPGFANVFDLDDVMRCIAPRRLFVVSSDSDPLSADAEDLVARVRPAFALDGEGSGDSRDELLSHLRVAGTHALDEQRFQAIVDWVLAQAASSR